VLAWLASFLVELGVLAVILLFAGNVILTGLPMLIVLIAIQTAFIFGLGMLLSGANAYFRDVQHFLAIALNVWFYATPILIPPNQIPETYELGGVEIPLRTLFSLNPMAGFVEAYRNLLYDLRGPTLATMIEVTIWAVVLVVLGLLAFHRLSPRLAEEL
jgi:ABC-type polysaccharide/polyol phosphate export permease